MKIIEMDRISLCYALMNGNVKTIKSIDIEHVMDLSMVGCIDAKGNKFLVDIRK